MAVDTDKPESADSRADETLEKHRGASVVERGFTVGGLSFRPLNLTTVEHADAFGCSCLLGLEPMPGADLDPAPESQEDLEELRKTLAQDPELSDADIEAGIEAMLFEHKRANLEVGRHIMVLAWSLQDDEDAVDDIMLDLLEAETPEESKTARRAFKKAVQTWKRNITSQQDLDQVSAKVIKACKRFQGLDFETVPSKDAPEAETPPGNS